MLAFHPYGGHDIRVVSDLSRFDCEDARPRIRSRNTTPNSILHSEADNFESKSRTQPSEYAPQNEIYQYYMKPSTINLDTMSEFAPYPTSVKGDNPLIPQLAPESPSNFHNSANFNKELPPISGEYFHAVNSSTLTFHEKGSLYPDKDSNDVRSFTTRQKEMEEILIKLVMNKPLFSVDLNKVIRDPNVDKTVTITANVLLYIFEVISAIIVITLSAILETRDSAISKGIYRYFIADQILSLITALLFITTVINFEKRNGSFYCTAACILTIVSFIMVVAVVLPHNHCPSKSVCDMRKAVSSFIIVSTLVWISDLVMFLTTVYISRLNLLEDINFDYSNRGLNNESPAVRVDPAIDPATGKPWPQYYMKGDGEIIEYDGSFNTEGAHRLIVYVP